MTGLHNTPHDAQPDNLAIERAAALLRTAANVLTAQASALLERSARRRREELRRVLAGVVADVETVRYSLKD